MAELRAALRDQLGAYAAGAGGFAHQAILGRGPHQLANALLLRSDLHTLFDLGYVTVDPHKRCAVISNRIREEFENGRDYYRFHGQPVSLPKHPIAIPAREFLAYHAVTKYRSHYARWRTKDEHDILRTWPSERVWMLP